MKSKNVRIVGVANLCRKVKVSPRSVEKLIHTLDCMRGIRCPYGEISVAIVNDRETVRLHKEYMDDATVTDVITFVGEEHPDEPFAGEICVNVDQAKREAKSRGCDWVDELTLYTVHGWLHLAGFRDKKPKEALLMRAAEKKALDYLSKLKVKLHILK